MRYDAVVFDNDGVLTTPTRRSALRDAIRSAFERVGVPDPEPETVEALMSPSVETLQDVARSVDVAPGQLWRAREREATAVQRAEIAAGRKTLYDDVTAVQSLEGPRAIVSNNQQATIDKIVDHFDLRGFDPSYGREPTITGIERKKPRPHYLEQAIREVGAARPLYVGDSQKDIVAANALGIDSAFIRRPHRADYELDQTATHEIDSLHELPALL